MKRLLIVAASSALLASPIFASAQAKNFEGFFAEAGLGYGTFSGSLSGGNLSSSANGAALGTYTANADTVKSIIGVIGGGYNFALTNEFVLGVGGSYSPSRSASAPSTVTVASPIPSLAGTTNGAGAVQNIYSLYLSPGYAISQDSLVYAKVGYTGATAVFSGPTPNLNLNGYVLGLGFKKSFDKNLYGFVEGKYASFGSKDLDPNSLNASITNTGSMTAQGMDIILGVGYKF
jgi:outer membrane immunogenic protein